MKQRLEILLAGMALLAAAGHASASGFALIEQSASGLGNAYAGGAASAEDASTIFYNPAGMLLLKGQQISGVLHYIAPRIAYSNERAANVAGSPQSGGSGGNAGNGKAVPNLFYSARISEQLAAGIGISSPFGLVSSYDTTWVGRYHAVKSDVMTLNINPAVAYRITDQFSVGIGFNAQYMKAELSNMIDFGLSAYTNSGNNPALLGAVSNPRADILGTLKGDSWGFGYNLGLLYTPSQETRVGLAYRSKVEHSLKGDATFSQRDGAYLGSLGLAGAAAATFSGQSISSDITLPASLSLSVYHRFTPAWAVMADVGWTQWSSFDKLVIDFDGSLRSRPSVTTENWRDVWRFSAGATFNPTPQLALRTGFAYDQTPVPDAAHRTPRIPDSDRYWLAIGVGYALSERINVDLGYAHLFMPDSRMSKSAAVPEDAARGTLVGSYSGEIDIISTQMTIRF